MLPVHAKSRVTTIATIRRSQKLSPNSVPKVLDGQNVKATEILAVGERASKHRVINIAEILAVKPERLGSLLVKREGDLVTEGDLLATKKRFLKKRKRILAPFNGRIVRIDGGQILLEGERESIEIEASMPGKITDIVRGQYIVIETSGAQIQIAWGHGGLRWGTLKVLDEEPSLVTPEDRFNIDHRGTIVAIGSPLTRGFLRGAAEIQVKGVLAPSMHASLIPMVEELPFPVGLTQGFGIYPMSGRILSLLNTYNGREIAIDMGMVSDWREKRPEIIIPLSTQQQGPGDDRNIALELEIGQKVRILQTPYLGEIGTVSELRADHYRLPSGIWSPGAMVEVPAGDTLFIPIANLEQLG